MVRLSEFESALVKVREFIHKRALTATDPALSSDLSTKSPGLDIILNKVGGKISFKTDTGHSGVRFLYEYNYGMFRELPLDMEK